MTAQFAAGGTAYPLIDTSRRLVVSTAGDTTSAAILAELAPADTRYRSAAASSGIITATAGVMRLVYGLRITAGSQVYLQIFYGTAVVPPVATAPDDVIPVPALGAGVAYLEFRTTFTVGCAWSASSAPDTRALVIGSPLIVFARWSP